MLTIAGLVALSVVVATPEQTSQAACAQTFKALVGDIKDKNFGRSIEGRIQAVNAGLRQLGWNKGNQQAWAGDGAEITKLLRKKRAEFVAYCEEEMKRVVAPCRIHDFGTREYGRCVQDRLPELSCFTDRGPWKFLQDSAEEDLTESQATLARFMVAAAGARPYCSGAAAAPTKPLPTLAKDPKVDGEIKDLAPALEPKMPESASGATAGIGFKATFKKDTLFLGVNVSDDKFVAGDQLDVTLFFPDSGMTAKGVVYRFGDKGLSSTQPELGAPEWALKLVKAATQPSKTGYTLELAVPARAMPRFQAFKQLAVSICVDYSDVDSEGGEPSKLTSCPTGEMVGGPTRLPDEFRKNLKLAPTPEVEGIEAREKGWLGYSKLHYPTWAFGDEVLTADTLAELVAGDTAIPPASVALPTPKLVLDDNRPIFTILTGKNPYVKEKCVADNELRMAMYVTKERVASRVLEWPAANCKLGKAMRVELGAEGSLEIGFTSGTTHHFTWTVDHFERSELGLNQ